MPSCKCTCRIINIKLCKHRFLSLLRSERAGPVTQLTLYPKGVGASTSMAVSENPPLWDPQGGKGERVVVLSDICAELLGNSILVRE